MRSGPEAMNIGWPELSSTRTRVVRAEGHSWGDPSGVRPQSCPRRRFLASPPPGNLSFGEGSDLKLNERLFRPDADTRVEATLADPCSSTLASAPPRQDSSLPDQFRLDLRPALIL